MKISQLLIDSQRKSTKLTRRGRTVGERTGTAHSHNLKVRHCVIVFVSGTEAGFSLSLVGGAVVCLEMVWNNGLRKNQTYEHMMVGLLNRFRVRVLLFRSKMSALPTDCSLVFAVCVYV